MSFQTSSMHFLGCGVEILMGEEGEKGEGEEQVEDLEGELETLLLLLLLLLLWLFPPDDVHMVLRVRERQRDGKLR